MSLFICKKCGVIENTALSVAWWEDKLCSECNPQTKKWHGKFPRRFIVFPSDEFCTACGFEKVVCECKK